MTLPEESMESANIYLQAAALHKSMAQANLTRGLAPSNPDAHVWNDAYNEEYEGLKGMDTFVEINEEEYQKIMKEYGEEAMAIPTMNIFTVKKNKEGNLVRAKSRIVVLGNLEKQIIGFPCCGKGTFIKTRRLQERILRTGIA